MVAHRWPSYGFCKLGVDAYEQLGRGMMSLDSHALFAASPWSSGAVVPARARKAQGAEQAAQRDASFVLVAAWPPTVRAGDLGKAGPDLLLDDEILHPGQQLLGLGQLQAERVRPTVAALQVRHVVHRPAGRPHLLRSPPAP